MPVFQVLSSLFQVQSHVSRVLFCATPWTVACQAPLSMGFSRQEYWNRLPSPTPGNLPDPGIEPESLCHLHWQAGSLPLASPGKPVSSRAAQLWQRNICTWLWSKLPGQFGGDGKTGNQAQVNPGPFCHPHFLLIPLECAASPGQVEGRGDKNTAVKRVCQTPQTLATHWG